MVGHEGMVLQCFLDSRPQTSLRFNRCTLVGKKLVQFLDSLGKGAPDQLAQTLRCEVVASILDGNECVLSYEPWVRSPGRDDLPPLERSQTLLAAFKRRVAWEAERNVYPAETSLIDSNSKIVAEHALTTLEDWNDYWGVAEPGAAQGIIQYQGGNVRASAELKPDEFRLRLGSAGYRAGPDGKDLGPDIDLVGPGAAYERWKKTPEYQQWLKETGQTP